MPQYTKSQTRIDLEQSLKNKRTQVEGKMRDLQEARRKLAGCLAEVANKSNILDLHFKEMEGILQQLNARIEAELELCKSLDGLNEQEYPRALTTPI
jgi:septal ring factor EnvC (AmiA/AmiB activator)